MIITANAPSWSKQHHHLALNRKYYSDYPALLQVQGSLTVALNILSSKPIVVRVRKKDFSPPSCQEKRRLSLVMLPTQSTCSPYWVREVWLCGQTHAAGPLLPWVFGRSVLPYDTFNQHATALQKIAHTALGSILFKAGDHCVQRTAFQYANLYPTHTLYHAALSHSAVQMQRSTWQYLWARQSVLYWDDAPLLITEVFFPTLIAHCMRSSTNVSVSA